MQSLVKIKLQIFIFAFTFLFLAQTAAWAALKIGVVLPLSGEQAHFGNQLKLWLEEVNQTLARQGVSFDLVYLDSRGSPSNIRKVVEDALWQKVNVLIGPLMPTCADVLVREARLYGLPVIVTSGEINPIKYLRNPPGPVFRTGISTRLAVKALYHCLKNRGIHKIGLLLTRDPFGREGEKWLYAYATEFALKIVKKRYFGVFDTDVTQHLEDMLDCDAIICWAPARSSLQVLKNIHRTSYAIPVYFSHIVDDEIFLKETSFNMPFVGPAFFYQGKNFPGDKNLLNVWLTYKQQYDLPDNIYFGAFADALIFLKEAIKKGGYNHWLKSMDRLRVVKGLTGIYFLSPDDHYGLISASLGVFQYNGFNFEPICKPQKGVF
ncbi:Extracellular ligand-binding receptor [Thermodesulfatator indicus DSM 15286]|uniref:Extracellular ligand-binding receptor n=1 Tax=Thermodesulfatator indicus (strain DSM 15286 / JCM 11887 / CIR29812) TaxID=667014 RepID=F8A948_THEID|nr:Extracellular ligand-binding receptor [Thermodesulfatator indicus DSM 15286]